MNDVHNANIVHRDIKTANIFMSNNSNNETVYKLGDFNVSKIIENSNKN